MEGPAIEKKEEKELAIKEEYDDSPIDSNPISPVRVKEEFEMNDESNEEQYIEISANTKKTENSSSEKSKALSKDETRGLLNLILQHPIITSRETNATFNYQKILEWNQITEDFNSTYSLYPRTTKQLRLKWENMKKNARRRNAKIRAMMSKTDQLNTEYIPRDEILEKVSTLLRKRPTDKASTASHDEESDDSDDDLPLVREGPKCLSPVKQEASNETQAQPTVSKTNLSHKHTNGFSEQPPRKKKKKDEGREARNRAMATYYEAKTKLIDANLINIKLQNEKLRLEIEILKRNKRT